MSSVAKRASLTGLVVASRFITSPRITAMDSSAAGIASAANAIKAAALHCAGKQEDTFRLLCQIVGSAN
ncbi:hypothetical protein V7S43_010031 [Phytophthora oleae]|uniref:Uncharacterized protein n=1 Tax=Phytophthora oleae TaxID=2107226 RepID=A0ABD3FDM8_9STRA